MKKLLTALFFLFLANISFAQVDSIPKNLDMQPLEKILLTELKIANLIKDAKNQSEVLAILKKQKDSLAIVDSIDVELTSTKLTNTRLKVFKFYSQDQDYHSEDYFFALRDSEKGLKIDENVEMDIKSNVALSGKRRNWDELEIKDIQVKNIKEGYRLLFKRIKAKP